MQAAQASLETATAEVQRLSAALQEVRGRAEQRRADMAAQSSQGAVVKALMAAKSAGSLPGIYGRLGELIAFHSAAWQDAKGLLGWVWRCMQGQQQQSTRAAQQNVGMPMRRRAVECQCWSRP